MRFKKKKKSYFLHRLKSKHHPLLFRRMAFLWVFLIFLEIACPLFECQNFAADLADNNSTVLSGQISKNAPASTTTFAKASPESQKTSIDINEQSVSDHGAQPEDCNDECLCHITPINVLSFEIPKYGLHTSVSPISIKFQPSSDLPPPYQPPQFS